ncbi:MAG: TetR/AcrR family transcriptional regulator [Rothia sp. (in: high G+C Gram-positive bacteria)]|nr:TetR/AcrR family transcriptional regulator [Rothia sp. (in: high G+C Gram-positive bacteria)]
MLKHTPPLDKRRARSTASQQKIAQAAEQLVLAHGRTGLTTSALVQTAGVSERTIFNHFKKLDDALTFRVAQYLEPIIDSPPFPSDLELGNIPAAITEHFHAAVDTEQVQETLARFLGLAAAISDEHFDGLAKELMLTISSICDRFCGTIDELYPQLTAQQSLANGLYTVNLLMGLLLAFISYAQHLEENIFMQGVSLDAMQVQDLTPFIHRNIDQVAGGTPVY